MVFSFFSFFPFYQSVFLSGVIHQVGRIALGWSPKHSSIRETNSSLSHPWRSPAWPCNRNGFFNGATARLPKGAKQNLGLHRGIPGCIMMHLWWIFVETKRWNGETIHQLSVGNILVSCAWRIICSDDLYLWWCNQAAVCSQISDSPLVFQIDHLFFHSSYAIISNHLQLTTNQTQTRVCWGATLKFQYTPQTVSVFHPMHFIGWILFYIVIWAARGFLILGGKNPTQ